MTEPVAPRTFRIAVVGAHLEGQPLHHQLSDRGASPVAATTTSDAYRLFALSTTPPKPGLVRSVGHPDAGPIDVEVWELGAAEFGEFVDEVPAPLAIGTIELADGSWVNGFVCESYALDGAPDITAHGGWRAYLDAG